MSATRWGQPPTSLMKMALYLTIMTLGVTLRPRRKPSNRFRFTGQQYQLSQHNTMLPPTVLRRADLKYKTKNHRGTIMSLIVFKRPIIQFYLYTTKPFHNRKSAIDFLRLIRSYGPYYLPTKYDFFEPIKQIFNSNDEKKFVRTWFGGSEITDKEAQEQNCEGGFIAKGKPPSKIDYHIMWEHKENTDRFNMICVSIAIPFLKKAANIWRNLFTFAMI